MEQTPIPTLQELQAQISRSISDATNRYQQALAHPNTLQPLMHPADTFFAPPANNPGLTTCLVCAAAFQTHAELCSHVEQSHSTLYSPLPVQSIESPSPLPAPGTLFPLQPFQTSSPISATPWAPVLAPPTPISAPILPQTPTPALSAKSGQYRCNICDIGCDTMATLNNHLVGQKHRKRLELSTAFRNAALRFAEEGISEVSPRLWVCQLCSMGLESEHMVLQHLEAVKHKRLRQSTAMERHRTPQGTTAFASLHAPENVASTPVFAAPSVLKDDHVSLPPLSSLISSSPFPASSFPLTAGFPSPATQPDRPSAVLKSTHQGPLRAAIAKNPRPPSAGISNKQSPASFSCSVCSVSCNSMDSLNAHLASDRHKRKQNIVKAANNQPSASVGISVQTQNFKCAVCSVMVCGQQNFEMHQMGKQHAKRLRMMGQAVPIGSAESSGSASTSPAPTPPRLDNNIVTTPPSALQSPQLQPLTQQSIQPPIEPPIHMPASVNSRATEFHSVQKDRSKEYPSNIISRE